MESILELEFLGSAKETDNKLRWDVIVDETPFSLYIPKWRVPEPWPRTIAVFIAPGLAESSEDALVAVADVVQREKLDSHWQPIIAEVSRFREHTRTLRYEPFGDANGWEIGSPYIPYSLTFNRSPELTLIVFWRVESAREFLRIFKARSEP